MPDWDEILRRDGPAVWRTAFRILGNRTDADECFQEAFVAALEVVRRQEVRHWRALLQRLATARAVDRLRQRRRSRDREQPVVWDNVGGSAPAPSQRAEDAELAETLRAALALIPSRQAEVFCLHVAEGWSYLEISRHLDISVNSVGVLIHRARKRLRRVFGTCPETASCEGPDAASAADRGTSRVGPDKESS